jgi:hypothetical protein
MLLAIWSMRALVTRLPPLTQLLICAPVGVLIGVAFICLIESQRKVAVQLFGIVRELKKNR